MVPEEVTLNNNFNCSRFCPRSCFCCSCVDEVNETREESKKSTKEESESTSLVKKASEKAFRSKAEIQNPSSRNPAKKKIEEEKKQVLKSRSSIFSFKKKQVPR